MKSKKDYTSFIPLNKHPFYASITGIKGLSDEERDYVQMVFAKARSGCKECQEWLFKIFHSKLTIAMNHKDLKKALPCPQERQSLVYNIYVTLLNRYQDRPEDMPASEASSLKGFRYDIISYLNKLLDLEIMRVVHKIAQEEKQALENEISYQHHLDTTLHHATVSQHHAKERYKELVDDLHEGLRRLDPRLRQVIDCIYFQNMNFRQTGSKLKMSRNTVSLYHDIALKLLRDFFEKNICPSNFEFTKGRPKKNA